MKNFRNMEFVRNNGGVFVVAVLLLFGLMFSCSSDKGNDEGLPVACLCEEFDNTKPVMLSQVATDIRYIPLETSDKCFVGSAHIDFEVKPGCGIFVKTVRSDIGVHYFDSDGKYIRPLGKRGRAKGEFVFNTNVVLAHDRDEIAIGSPQKTVIYSLEDKFLKEIIYDTLAKHAPFIGSLRYLGNGRYANMCTFPIPMKEAGNPNVYMATFSDSGKMDGLYPIMEEKISVIRMDDGSGMVQKNIVLLGQTYTLCGEAAYARVGEDTLFKFDENFKLVPFLALDYGKYEEMEWNSKICLEQGDDAIHQIGDKLLFRIRGPKDVVRSNVSSTMSELFSVMLMVYDMKTSEMAGLKANADMGILGFENDIDGGAPFCPQVVEGGKMYQIMDAITFMEVARKSSSAKMKEVAALLTENSNPVVVEATIRK